jgi:hypothetical protein
LKKKKDLISFVNVVNIFSKQQYILKTQAKMFLSKSFGLTKNFLTNQTQKKIIYSTLFLQGTIFKNSRLIFFIHFRHIRYFIYKIKLIKKTMHSFFDQKVNLSYLILSLQEQTIFKYYSEFFLFEFFDSIDYKKSKKIISKISLLAYLSIYNKKLNVETLSTNFSKILSMNFNKKLSLNRYTLFFIVTLFTLNTNWNLSNESSFKQILTTFTGKNWFKNQFVIKKKLTKNLRLKTKDALKHQKMIQLNLFKNQTIKIFKSTAFKFRYFLKKKNTDFIYFYQLEFNKKFYKSTNHSLTKNFFDFETSFFDIWNFKKEISFRVLPLLTLLITTKYLQNLLYLHNKTELFLNFFKKPVVVQKIKKLQFYCLKHLFNRFWLFYLKKTLSSSTLPIRLNTFCYKTVLESFCQPSSFINNQFHFLIKKNQHFFTSFSILDFTFDFTNFNNLTPSYLEIKDALLLNFHQKTLKFVHLRFDCLNLSSSLKLIKLEKLLLLKAKLNIPKLLSINEKKNINFIVFFSLLKTNTLVQPEREIEKPIFNLLKKINLLSVIQDNSSRLVLKSLNTHKNNKFFNKTLIIQNKIFFLKDFENAKPSTTFKYTFLKFQQNIKKSDFFLISKKIWTHVFFMEKYFSLVNSFFLSVNLENRCLSFFKRISFYEKIVKCLKKLNYWCNNNSILLKSIELDSSPFFSKKVNFSIPKNKKINFKELKIFYPNYSVVVLPTGLFNITPTSFNIFQHFIMLKKLVKVSSTQTQELLIKTLTPKIYAWCYYYKHISNQQIFYYSDDQLFNLLWRWTCRRHNNKSKKWIKSKYFYKLKEKTWIFGTIITSSLILGASRPLDPLGLGQSPLGPREAFGLSEGPLAPGGFPRGQMGRGLGEALGQRSPGFREKLAKVNVSESILIEKSSWKLSKKMSPILLIYLPFHSQIFFNLQKTSFWK